MNYTNRGIRPGCYWPASFWRIPAAQAAIRPGRRATRRSSTSTRSPGRTRKLPDGHGAPGAQGRRAGRRRRSAQGHARPGRRGAAGLGTRRAARARQHAGRLRPIRRRRWAKSSSSSSTAGSASVEFDGKTVELAQGQRAVPGARHQAHACAPAPKAGRPSKSIRPCAWTISPSPGRRSMALTRAFADQGVTPIAGSRRRGQSQRDPVDTTHRSGCRPRLQAQHRARAADLGQQCADQFRAGWIRARPRRATSIRKTSSVTSCAAPSSRA